MIGTGRLTRLIARWAAGRVRSGPVRSGAANPVPAEQVLADLVASAAQFTFPPDP